MHALAIGSRVRLKGRRSVLSGVIDCRADHGDRHALPAVAAPHGDAGDDPRRDVVDGRGRARVLDPREVVTRSERDKSDRFAATVRDQAGGVLPTSRQLREHRPAPRIGRAGIAAGDAKFALLRGGVAREEVPAG